MILLGKAFLPGISMSGAISVSFMNVVDVAPCYSGSLTGAFNTVGSLAGFIVRRP